MIKKIKFFKKEYPLQIFLLVIGIIFQLIKNLPISSAILPKFINDFYKINYGFVENLIYALVFTNLLFIIVDYFSNKNTFLFDSYQNIRNDQIADEVINKKNVFMIRFTLHPKVDEAEEEISDYSFSNEQWDWHICLCDPEHKNPSKYNDFSYLLNSFFDYTTYSKTNRKYKLRDKLKTTELGISNLNYFTDLVRNNAIPYIDYLYRGALKKYDLYNFQSVIFIGVFSSEPQKSTMPNLEEFIRNMKDQKDNIQFHRLIFNIPNINNNLMFTNTAADKISKHFFSKIKSFEYEKSETNEILSIYIPDEVNDELKQKISTDKKQNLIDYFHLLLNEKTFKYQIEDNFKIEEWLDFKDVEKFIKHNKYVLKKLEYENLKMLSTEVEVFQTITDYLKNNNIKTIYFQNRQ